MRIKDTPVPDHVFLGLIDGTIKGPLNAFPKIYAVVSLKNAIKTNRYNKFLSLTVIEKKFNRNIRTVIKKNLFK